MNRRASGLGPRASGRILALSLAVAACHVPHVAAPVVPPPGVAIALYRAGDRALAVVDERSWVTIEGGAFTVGPVDPATPLAQLLVEPLDDPALQIGACTRAGYALRCATSGAARALVRVVYVTSALHYEARHVLDVTAPDRAALATRLEVATPAWGVRADVTVFDGAPGGDRAPRELVRAPVTLDGTTAALDVPRRTLAARLVRVYDGAVVRQGVPPTDPAWGRASTRDVLVALELPDAPIAAGPVHVHVALPGEPARDADLALAPGAHRLTLGTDDTLHGTRLRMADFAGGDTLADVLSVSITNTGAAPREVWIEEPLRAARVRRVSGAWPGPARVVGDVVRLVVRVPAGGRAGAGCTVAYDF